LKRRLRGRRFPASANISCMRNTFGALLLACLTACSPQRLFYYPNRVLYQDPARMGLSHQVVEYPSLDGKPLTGVLFPTAETPKGTIVFFHGNFGNLSNHFTQCQFLTRDGFDVLIFDYEGYGASEGKPTPKRTIEDGIATVRYATTHNRNPKGGVVVFGQSLGGAVAVVVAAREPLVKAAVIESAFSSYRAMARSVLGRHWWTWPLVPIAPLFLSRTYDPADFIGAISPRPVLIIHGDRDNIVPPAMSRQLYERARKPKKLWIVQGAGHLGCRTAVGKHYEDEIADFFTKALSPLTVKDKN
jgi:fermentation-respiration switch protein FrsA (DUF1100 family)